MIEAITDEASSLGMIQLITVNWHSKWVDMAAKDLSDLAYLCIS